MNSLKIPEAGLLLQGPLGQETPLPPQAFAFSLSGNLVDSLVKAVRDGGSIRLSLGKAPVRTGTQGLLFLSRRMKLRRAALGICIPTDSHLEESL